MIGLSLRSHLRLAACPNSARGQQPKLFQRHGTAGALPVLAVHRSIGLPLPLFGEVASGLRL